MILILLLYMVYGTFNGKVIQDTTFPFVNNVFVHNPAHPLLVSSKKGIDFIFIPIIYSGYKL